MLAGAAAAALDGAVVHAANSAGALAHPAARALARAGRHRASTASRPAPASTHLAAELRPALSLQARVSFVKRVAAGERMSYGLRHARRRPTTTVATVPLGYADGVPRRLSNVGDRC